MPTIQLLHLVYGQLIRPQVKIGQLDVISSSYNKMYQTLSYMYDEADIALFFIEKCDAKIQFFRIIGLVGIFSKRARMRQNIGHCQKSAY